MYGLEDDFRTYSKKAFCISEAHNHSCAVQLRDICREGTSIWEFLFCGERAKKNLIYTLSRWRVSLIWKQGKVKQSRNILS